MLHVLRLAGDLHIPPLVVEELARHLPVQPIPEWITVDSLSPVYDAEAVVWQQAGLLDAGEAEAIALARQIEADWLLTDDAAARLLATELGLEVHGSLGIILWAAAVGHLDYDEADRALMQLVRSSLWISNKILVEAQSALREMFLSS